MPSDLHWFRRWMKHQVGLRNWEGAPRSCNLFIAVYLQAIIPCISVISMIAALESLTHSNSSVNTYVPNSGRQKFESIHSRQRKTIHIFYKSLHSLFLLLVSDILTKSCISNRNLVFMSISLYCRASSWDATVQLGAPVLLYQYSKVGAEMGFSPPHLVIPGRFLSSFFLKTTSKEKLQSVLKTVSKPALSFLMTFLIVFFFLV